MSSYKQIISAIYTLPVIDTHEHIPVEKSKMHIPKDCIQTYFGNHIHMDLISAGLTERLYQEAMDDSFDLHERFAIIEPYFDMCKMMGQGRAVAAAASGLHGVEEITKETIHILNDSFNEATSQKDYTYNTIVNRCSIEHVMIDVKDDVNRFDCDKRVFSRVWRPEKYVNPIPVAGKFVQWLEAHYHPIKTLDDWMAAFQEELSEVLYQGIKVVMVDLACCRSIRFRKIPYKQAKKEFDKVMEVWSQDGRGVRDHFEFSKDLQDYIMGQIFSSFRGRDITVQIHTGLQQGDEGLLKDARPMLLDNTILRFENVKFDLIHSGWPWWNEVVALCKKFSNVTLDLAWVHSLSPQSAVQCVLEAIGAVPANKILGFGGNAEHPDIIYGQLEIARINIARALSIVVDQEIITPQKAIDVAKLILYDNPKRVLNIQ
ncbi:MAG: amidohydrolase family protein [Clostridiales bacterium]|nr:amidohydrolase family protein [Clostridiales bacterium]